MKKDVLRASVVTLIVLGVYHLIAFAVPFCHKAAFWISYGFTLASFAVLAGSIYIAFIAKPSAKSRFYGFPIARIGFVYAVIQLFLSLVVMGLAKWLPWWIPTVVYAIAFGAAVIGLVGAEAVVDEIEKQDSQQKTDIAMMRAIQSKVSQLAAQSSSPSIAKLAEEFRYSDPVSCDAIADAEADLAAAVDDLQIAFVDGDREAVEMLCQRSSSLLAERNRLCKLNKN